MQKVRIKIRYFLLAMFCAYSAKQYAASASFSLDANQDKNAWKEYFRQDFLQNLSYMQNIVVVGETPEETIDFLRYFNQQVLWIDGTLARVQQPTDSELYKLNQKKMAVANVVKAHQAAEALLQERLNGKVLKQPSYVALRLMLLYEINSFLQAKGLGENVLVPAQLTDQQKSSIVDNVLGQSLVVLEPPLESKESLEKTQKILQQQLGQTQEKLQKIERENSQQAEDYKKKIETLTSANDELTKAISTAKKEVLVARNERIEATLKTHLIQELSQKEIAAKESENSHLPFIVQSEQLHAAKAVLEQRLEQVQNILKKVQQEKADLKKECLAKVASVVADDEKQRRSGIEMQQERDMAKAELVRIQHSLTEQQAKMRLSDELAAQSMQQTSQAVASLKTQRDEVVGAIQQLQESLSMSEKQLTIAKQENLDQAAQMSKKIESLASDNAALTDRLELTVKDADRTKQELKASLYDITIERNKRVDAQAQLALTQELADRRVSENSQRIQQELQAQKQEAEKVVNNLQQKLDQAENLLNLARQEKERLSNEYDMLQKRSLDTQNKGEEHARTALEQELVLRVALEHK